MRNLSNENIIHIEKDGISYIQFRKLLEYDYIAHGYTVGLDNNMRTTTSKGKNVNYENGMHKFHLLCNYLGINFNDCYKASVNHTDNVCVIDTRDNLPMFEVLPDKNDGILTDISNINLITTSSDCITFFLFDKEKNVIANVHSGWRGTYNGILINALKRMHEYFGCNYKDIMIFICPAIRDCHFEVNFDVFDLFSQKYGYMGNIITKNEDKWNIDTILINKVLANDLGIREDNIYDSELCTVCNSDVINSLRAHGKDFNLNAGIIGIKGKAKCLKKN